MSAVPRLIGAKVNYTLLTSKMAEIKETLRLQMEKISKSLPEKIFADSSEEEDHDDTDEDPNYEPRGQYICLKGDCFYFFDSATRGVTPIFAEQSEALSCLTKAFLQVSHDK